MNHENLPSTYSNLKLIELAADEPARVIRLADAALPTSLPSDASTLHRALGIAKRSMSDAEASLVHLDEAVALAGSTGLLELEARARLSRALTLNMLGRSQDALDDLAWAEPHLTGIDAADLLFQRGSILLQLGRLEEAELSFNTALPVFQAGPNRMWEGDLLANRGIVHTYRGALVEARTDLTRALEIFERTGASAAAADTLFNLGFLQGRMGDIVQALSNFEEAERRMVALGHPIAELPADRAEVLLASGLVAEAAERSMVAARVQERRGLALLHAESLLLHARASLADQRLDRASEIAESAHELFVQQQRLGWAAQASILALRARLAAGRLQSGDLDVVAELVSHLHTQGQVMATAEASTLLARVGVRSRRLEVAERALHGALLLQRSGSVEAKTQYWLATAEYRLAKNDRRGAAVAAYSGLQAVEKQRSLLGATDVRAHISLHGEELAGLGLRLAVEAGQARRTLLWTELGRAVGLDVPPLQPPSDAALDADLRELRRTVADIAEAEAVASPSDKARRSQARVQQRILDRTRRSGRSLAPVVVRMADIEAVGSALGHDQTLISYCQIDQELHAVVVVGGRFSLRAVGPVDEVRRGAEHLRFTARRLALAPSGSAIESNLAAADDVDRLLFQDLPIASGSLVVSPPAWLFDLPWSALATLGRHPTSVSPSSRAWLKARDAGRRQSQGAVAIAGPGLSHADDEVARIGAVHEDSTVVTESVSRAAEVLRLIDGVDVVHFACHGVATRQNPMFSSLELGDGQLTLYELQRLEQAPRLVVLSSCDSGGTATRPGDELMGFAASLLSMGSSAVVASTAPVVDSALTTLLMEQLHLGLKAGQSPAVALALAVQADHPDPLYRALAGSFVCMGSG